MRREKQNDIPFIMFTGKGREYVVMKSLNLGANQYLQKGGDLKSQYGLLMNSIFQEVERNLLKKELKCRLDFEKVISNISTHFVEYAVNLSLEEIGELSGASRMMRSSVL